MNGVAPDRPPDRLVLDTCVRVAMEATGAARGRILSSPDEGPGDLEVAAARGGDRPWASTISEAQHLGLVRYVLATGQAQVVASPGAVLCAPCVHGDIVKGVLDLGGKAGEGRFTIDDMELVTLVAGIAAAALVSPSGALAPSPEELTLELSRLAATDPAAYSSLARVLQSLLYA